MIGRYARILALLAAMGAASNSQAFTVLRAIPGIDRLPNNPSNTADDTSLSNDPILRIEIGTHSARILSSATDSQGKWLVTAAADKSVRVWEIATGKLIRVLRPPVGPGIVGDIYRAVLSPDGSRVAVGWQSAQRAAIFVFDRATGQVTVRIDGLADVVSDVQFSPNGRLLAATVVRGGVQLFDSVTGRELGKDLAYGLDSYSVDFSPDGRRILTSSLDGRLRLYSIDGGRLQKIAEKPATTLRSNPLNARFSPDGQWIAVGYDSAGGVKIFRAMDLTLVGPVNDIFVWSNIPHFAWSRDGRFLDGLGSDSSGQMMIRRWSAHEIRVPGGSPFDILSSHVDIPIPGQGSISNPTALPDGGLLIATQQPAWGILSRDGTLVWRQLSAESRHGSYVVKPAAGPTLSMSADGTQVGFQYQYGGVKGGANLPSGKFDLKTLDLGSNLQGLTPSRQSAPALKIRSGVPYLNGRPVPLAPNEIVTSYAISPSGDRLAVGTTLALNIYDGGGQLLGRVTAFTDAVGISGDGRWVVADLADGTIRWYRASDGKEQLALYPHPDRVRWALWTPSGYYASSIGGDELIGWQINRGAAAASDFFPISRFQREFYRPDVIAKVLGTGDETQALRVANEESGRPVLAAPSSVQDVLPPVVGILSPDDGMAVSASPVVLSVAVHSAAGAPSTALTARVNGHPVAVTIPKGASLDGTVQISVPVPSQDADVQVFAANKNATSAPAVIHLAWKGAAPPPAVVNARPKLFLLAIGVSRYDNPAYRLQVAAKDAADFATAMTAQKGLAYRDVEVQLLTDGKATTASVLAGLQWLQQHVTANDFGMVMMAGHGLNDAKGEYYFAPANFDLNDTQRTGVVFSAIKSALVNLSGTAVFFVDTCHSGNVLGGRRVDTVGLVNDLTHAENGVVVLSASKGSQDSLEKAEWGNGAFTKAVLEGLDGKADFAKNGKITLKGMDLYVSQRVEDLTDHQQTPVIIAPYGLADFQIAATTRGGAHP